LLIGNKQPFFTAAENRLSGRTIAGTTPVCAIESGIQGKSGAAIRAAAGQECRISLYDVMPARL
jgi:hypothetical protein